MLHITEVKHIRKKIMRVSFDDGVSGDVDFDGALQGPIFASLNDEVEFSKAYVDSELETIAWSNGADFAPEFVRQLFVEQNESCQHG